MSAIDMIGQRQFRSKILFVDDEKEMLSTVKGYLSQGGYGIRVTDYGPEALELAKKDHFDVIITDLNMPDLNGLELLKGVKKIQPDAEVIIITGYGTIETAVQALKFGGYDYLQKPVNLARLKLLIDRILEKKQLKEENLQLKHRLKGRYCYDDLIGLSPQMQHLYEIIDRINMDASTVLIQGESGTGKEVVAKVIHKNSDRKDGPFVSINCGALVEGLLETELFGHVKGAFTGAVRDKEGLMKVAEGGTIFLDEIAEMPRSLQVKLLRALQEKMIRPVGATRELKIDARVMAATNKDLDQALRKGKLRRDLYYRLNVVSIHLPPLRERKEDILPLVNHFIAKIGKAHPGKGVKNLSPEALRLLMEFDWPGNVRELENVVERAMVLGINDAIGVDDLPPEIRGKERTDAATGKNYNLRQNEISLIKRALVKTNGKKAEASRLLGINLSTLYRKIARYQIPDLHNANA
ncbi:MAG: sigma-54 dependent transcriptional regulator [Deltaproteobacteria bacterium]|nr:sigma-54 dependent transcriptional regulator [Deltaproteobacteria bacterium]